MTDCLNYVLANIACIVFLSIVMFTLARGVDKQVSTLLLEQIIQALCCSFGDRNYNSCNWCVH